MSAIIVEIYLGFSELEEPEEEEEEEEEEEGEETVETPPGPVVELGGTHTAVSN
jgi:hypothetical protein